MPAIFMAFRIADFTGTPQWTGTGIDICGSPSL